MNTLAVTGLAAVCGYLLGSVSPATLVARRYGADLRSSGSGNPGATNVGRLLGRRAGVLVGVADVMKGLLPALVFGLALHEAGLVAGLAAVLGHITSPFLHGHGGKGVATAGGAVLGAHPLWALGVVAVWLLVLAASRWVALASVTAALAIPLAAVASRSSVMDVGWSVALALVVVVRHWSNYVRWRDARRSGPGRRRPGRRSTDPAATSDPGAGAA